MMAFLMGFGFILTLVLGIVCEAWQEPAEVRGLKFGDDVTQVMRECPFTPPYDYERRLGLNTKHYNPYSIKERCWEETTKDHYLLHNLG